jgi:hypothetical protein
MSCTDKRASGKKGTLAELVAEFLEQDGCCPRGEMKMFTGLKIEAAISKAALARDDSGNLFSHQWHFFNHPEIPPKAESILLASVNELLACKDFDALHALVKSKLQIPFAGELYWYDTAFRIGISMGIFPTKVYLHAGTKAGAMALGIYKGNGILKMSDLPAELQKMKPHQVEDFLCIKKDVLYRFKQPESAASDSRNT